MHILRCMGSKFCMKFQRCPLKFHTKFGTHTPQNMQFTRCQKFDELWYPSDMISYVLVIPVLLSYRTSTWDAGVVGDIGDVYFFSLGVTVSCRAWNTERSRLSPMATLLKRIFKIIDWVEIFRCSQSWYSGSIISCNGSTTCSWRQVNTSTQNGRRDRCVWKH